VARTAKKSTAKNVCLPQENSKTFDESAVQRIVLGKKLKEKLGKH